MMNYCTIEGGARILRVSRPTVYKLIEDGKLGRYTVLGRPALKLTEVNRVAKARRTSSKKSNGNGK